MYQGHINKQDGYVTAHLIYQSEYQEACDWLADVDKQIQELIDVGSESHTVEDKRHKVQVIIIAYEELLSGSRII